MLSIILVIIHYAFYCKSLLKLGMANLFKFVLIS